MKKIIEQIKEVKIKKLKVKQNILNILIRDKYKKYVKKEVRLLVENFSRIHIKNINKKIEYQKIRKQKKKNEVRRIIKKFSKIHIKNIQNKIKYQKIRKENKKIRKKKEKKKEKNRYY